METKKEIKMKKETGKYDDLINLPHPEPNPVRHPRMSLENRAAQFAPFAALTGYEEEIREASRLTVEQADTDEQELEKLDYELAKIRTCMKENPGQQVCVRMICYVPDEKKDGGAYETAEGAVRRIDENNQMIVLQDGRTFSAHMIKGLSIEQDGNGTLCT